MHDFGVDPSSDECGEPVSVVKDLTMDPSSLPGLRCGAWQEEVP
jgi:hypothetical protein